MINEHSRRKTLFRFANSFGAYSAVSRCFVRPLFVMRHSINRIVLCSRIIIRGKIRSKITMNKWKSSDAFFITDHKRLSFAVSLTRSILKRTPPTEIALTRQPFLWMMLIKCTHTHKHTHSHIVSMHGEHDTKSKVLFWLRMTWKFDILMIFTIFQSTFRSPPIYWLHTHIHTLRSETCHE